MKYINNINIETIYYNSSRFDNEEISLILS